MTASNRLRLTAAMVVVSVLYGILVLADPEVASAIAIGYIALILTAITCTNWRKRP